MVLKKVINLEKGYSNVFGKLDLGIGLLSLPNPLRSQLVLLTRFHKSNIVF